MKKICHFTSVHSSADVRIFLKECVSLANAGFETHLVSTDGESSVCRGVILHTVPKRNSSRFGRMIKVALSVYRKAKSLEAEIYHFHDPELIPYGLLLKLSGKKVIYDVHEDVPDDILSKHWIPVWLRQIVSGCFRLFENFSARRFDVIVGATPHISERFLRVGCRQVINVNNYPILSELCVDGELQSERKRQVCYIGGIDEIRGVREMVLAAGKADVRLVLAGKFISESLLSECRQLSGWNNVDYRGLVNREEVASILSESRAGLVLFYPERNHVNAQPNKLFEYMSAGVPLIASNFPLWEEIVIGNECGLCVDPLKTDRIAQVILKIVDDRALVEQFGERGSQMIDDKFNWQIESKKLIDLYNRMDP